MLLKIKLQLVYAVSQASPPSGPVMILEILEGERAKFPLLWLLHRFYVVFLFHRDTGSEELE